MKWVGPGLARKKMLLLKKSSHNSNIENTSTDMCGWYTTYFVCLYVITICYLCFERSVHVGDGFLKKLGWGGMSYIQICL